MCAVGGGLPLVPPPGGAGEADHDARDGRRVAVQQRVRRRVAVQHAAERLPRPSNHVPSSASPSTTQQPAADASSAVGEQRGTGQAHRKWRAAAVGEREETQGEEQVTAIARGADAGRTG